MAAEADNFAPDTAEELIEEFGIPAVVAVPGLMTYSVVENRAVQLAVENVDVTCTPPLAYSKKIQTPDGVLHEVSRCFLRGDISFVPQRGQRLVLSGVNWTIVQVDPMVSGLRTAAYRLYIET